MNKNLNILHLEDNYYDFELISTILTEELPAENYHCNIIHARNNDEFKDALRTNKFDLVISDYTIPGYSGFEALSFLHEYFPDIPFLFVSGTIGEEKAIECIKKGARDYIIKDRPKRIISSIINILKEEEAKKELKRSESELNKTAGFLSLLIESMPVSIYSSKADGNYSSTFVSANITKITGYSAEDFILNPDFWSGNVHPDDIKNVFSGIGELFEKGYHEHEYRFKISDGSYKWFYDFQRLVKIEGEEPKIVGVWQDISERKLKEQEISKQNTLLTSILEATNDAILVLNLKGEYESYNNKFLEIFNISPALAETKDSKNILEYAARQLINPEDFLSASDETYSQTEKYFYDTLYLNNGKIIERNSNPFILEGNIAGRVWSYRDITEKKKLEDDFLRLQRVENIGAIANGIAHDLNNVLSPILMASEYFDIMLEDEDSKSFIAIIEKSVNHATDLIRQILSFGRGANETVYNIKTNSLIANIIYMIKSTFPKTIRITQDFADNLWDISGNQTELNQVLMNICINARDAMPKGGSLKISTRNNSFEHEPGVKSGKYIEISIADTGEGIPPEIIDKIFDPFFTTKDTGKGTGLGLDTTQRIIKNHGGFIKLKSEPGIGTEFKIYLPTEKSGAISNISIDSNKIPSGNNELVLVVDDELSIREMMKATLEVYNYRVLTAAQGMEAISIYSANKDEVRVIFVDLVMPLFDGVDTITVLREINPKSKIIALTGLAEGRNILGNPEEFPILQKPFAGEQMLITLNEVLKS
jgi:PAS domain S-box-containing protein